MKKEWSAGKIVGVALGSVAVAMILFIALVISIYQLISRIVEINEYQTDNTQDYRQEQEYDADSYDDNENDNKYESHNDDSQADKEAVEDWWEQEDRAYYELHDEIRKDLSYQVTFLTDSYSSGKNVNSRMTYPLITGENVPNIDGVNNAIQKELTVVRGYMDQWVQALSAEDECKFEGESYVTYMDEKLFSTVYYETGYINDEVQESYLVSVNIDMETGMIISNTQILNLDDDFSIEFRKRSDEQNGEISTMPSLSDQDITKYLTDNDRLIIFYTPLGMEVGINIPGGWITVTYSDYEKFRKQL